MAGDYALSCDTILPFYIPIALLMFFAVTVGIPCTFIFNFILTCFPTLFHLHSSLLFVVFSFVIVLYYVLIRQHAHLLKLIPCHDKDDEGRWTFRIHASQNSAKTLYNQFELSWYVVVVTLCCFFLSHNNFLHFCLFSSLICSSPPLLYLALSSCVSSRRYFKCLLILQKLFLVILSLFVVGSRSLALGVCVMHGSYLLLALYSQPYVSRVLVSAHVTFRVISHYHRRHLPDHLHHRQHCDHT